MRFATSILALALSAAQPMAAMAQDQDFFVGIDVLGGMAFGSSSTTDGGGILPLFDGDGVVGNVSFGKTIGIGGHVGYRFDPAWSAILSYQHIRGDISWDATFTNFGGASEFAGDAISNAIIGNVAYERPLSQATAMKLSAGLGVSFNKLTGIVETNKPTGEFVSDVAGKTKAAPLAQIGAGIHHKLTHSATIGLDALLAYTSGFETGNTRSGNLGVTEINPYKIDDVWRTNLGASFRLDF